MEGELEGGRWSGGRARGSGGRARGGEREEWKGRDTFADFLSTSSSSDWLRSFSLSSHKWSDIVLSCFS